MRTTATILMTIFVSCASAAQDEVRVSSFGFDAEDSTRFLQAAINSGARRVVIDRQKSAWITEPLFCVSDQEIVFEKGVVVEAKKGAFHGRNDCLFTLRRVHDVNLIGQGAILRMHHDDYMSEAYSRSEWRHCVCILSSEHIRLEGLEIRDSGGDGVYVANEGRNGPPSKDVVMRHVVSDGNARQGSSIINVEGLLYEDCTFSNTHGRPPQAGVDIEPNSGSETVCDCIFRRCRFEDNEGEGFAMSYPKEREGRKPGSVRLECCVFKGNRCGFTYGQGRKEPYYVKGSLVLTDCTFERTMGSALVISRKIGDTLKVEVSNCRIVNCCAKQINQGDIRIDSLYGDIEPPSSIIFTDVEIVQSIEHDWMLFSNMPYGSHNAVKFGGNVCVKLPSGTRRIVLDEKFIAEAFPGFWNEGEPMRRKVGGEGIEVVDQSPGCMIKLTPMTLGGSARYAFYAEKSGAYPFRGKLVSRKAGAEKLTIKGASPLAADGSFTVEVGRSGLHVLELEIEHATFTLLESQVPVALDLSERPLDLRASTGDVFFFVRKGESFNAMVSGESYGEKIGCGLFDPEEHEVWNEAAALWWRGYRARGAVKEGLWKLVLRRPKSGRLEDYHVDVTGASPCLFLSSEKYWR